MCGRYLLTDFSQAFAERFKVSEVSELPGTHQPRHNVSPTQLMPVITKAGGSNQLELMSWGLIPSWSREPKEFINARSETAATKPSFRRAFRTQRCIVPASGFFEWKKTASGKLPYLLGVKGQELFGMAGLYDTWTAPDGSPIKSYTILTCGPNELTATIHDRMPCILKPEGEDLWLMPENRDPAWLQRLLAPYPAEQMEAFIVSRAVNDPANDSPELIKPVTYAAA
jgi:putative SOS response-associated peptidase YedK